MRQLQPQAVNGWWQPGHPGWAIYPVDSDSFMNTGALDNVAVLHDHIVAPLPPSPAGLQGMSAEPLQCSRHARSNAQIACCMGCH